MDTGSAYVVLNISEFLQFSCSRPRHKLRVTASDYGSAQNVARLTDLCPSVRQTLPTHFRETREEKNFLTLRVEARGVRHLARQRIRSRL